MKSIKFMVPGRPVPAVRTTKRQMRYDKQYQRYEAYKHIVRLSYLMAHIDLILPSTEKRERTRIISEKRSMMLFRGQLLEMIGTASADQSNYVVVEITKEVNK